MSEVSESLWEGVKGLFSSENEEAKQREMVMAPLPSPPKLKRSDYPEGVSGNIDYKLAKRAAENEYRRMVEDREMNPDKYLVPAAYAEADVNREEEDYTRTRDIEETMRAMEE